MPVDSLLRPPLTWLLKLLFRVEVSGLEHVRAAGDRALIIANHLSYLDPFLLAVLLPEKPAFAISVYQAEKWYLRWLDRVVTLYRVDPLKPLSMKRLIQDLRSASGGRTHVVIFPEGRISTSGGIMKIYSGAGLIVEKTGAPVVVARIDGAEYSKLSRLGGKLRRRWFPKIRLAFMPPVRFAPDAPVSSRAIYDLMAESAFNASRWRRSFLEATLDAYEWHGGGHALASDITRADINYRQLFTRAFILRDKLALSFETQEDSVSLSSPRRRGSIRSITLANRLPPTRERHEYIGMLLPNALAAMVSFVALHMLGRIPCMLNYSAGSASIRHACHIAGVGTIITSRAFIEKAELGAVIEALREECRVLYLEDVRETVGLKDKLIGLWRALFARRCLRGALARVTPDDPAVIIYTSGSEGAPKGVALSHANILANIGQVCGRLDVTPADRLFNAMPVFHSFGLTVGMLMPAARGIFTFLYPSPLHYRVIPDLVYDTDATIMLGTDTFYNGYARYAHPYDFARVRLAVAGAEKLKEATRHLYADALRVPILEGYGVSEASPVISVNTPMEHREQTVGRALPGMECRLEPVEGIRDGGRLFVKGPNVMLGYLKGDRPGVIQPQGEWYDTGDIVAVDADGFLSIRGRAKRFAKIAGEMVSLAIAEELAAALAPDAAHAALAIPDERKGEQVVLFTESAALSKDQLTQHARQAGVAEICLPKQIIALETLPRLGNGKIDYVTLAKR